MNQTSYDEFECPPSEIDIPLCEDDTNPTTSMPSQEADRIEKWKRFKAIQNHFFKLRGLYLIIGCLIGYFILVVLDSILLNVFEWQTSSLVTNFVELLKFLVSTLIGFVFSENLKKEE